MKKFNISSQEIELALSNYFGIRKNLIVPNVSWGLGIHECDLLILSKSGYCTEIEIKISLSDLKKDLLKSHSHKNDKIKYLYFCIPSYLAKHVEFIPKNAGILIINSAHKIFKISESQKNITANKLNDDEKFIVARLGALRIWDLKSKCIGYKNDRKYLLNKIEELKKVSS